MVMESVVEQLEPFATWYANLNDRQSEAVDRGVAKLMIYGPLLGRPHADTVRESRFANMKELRVQAGGNPLRILYAFDPRRVGMLLIGGDKTGDQRFYEKMVAIADHAYAEHLAKLFEEEKRKRAQRKPKREGM